MLPPASAMAVLEEHEAAAGARDTLPDALAEKGEDVEGGEVGAEGDDHDTWPMGGAWGGGAW